MNHVSVDCEFPGGNGIVDEVTDRVVRLHQDLRDTSRDWFYWCVRVRGAAGRTVRFEFTRSAAIGCRGPAISHDHGASWTWLGRECVDGNAFTCTFPSDAAEVRLSFAMPYQESHWRDFMSRLAGNPYVTEQILCTTPRHRPVESVLLGRPVAGSAHRAAITCRHHCCEMMANYVLEGFIAWVADDPGVEAAWMRDRVQFFIVPFVDKDGVEDGDQGKCRRPRDHGRDYEGQSLYTSTAAIRAKLPEWSRDQLCLGLDLHCPYIAGEHQECIYLVGSPHPHIALEQKRFSETLERISRGPLRFRAGDFLPFGTAWNTGTNYAGGKGFARWLAELPGVRLATAIEIPYANAGGAEVNQDSARAFGADLGRAVSDWFRN